MNRPFSMFLSPSGLTEYESSPTVAILRHGFGLGRLLPRPQYAGYDLGRAVDARLKTRLRGEQMVWSGATLVPRRKFPEVEDAEIAARADRLAAYYCESGEPKGLTWDPTHDLVAWRVVDGVPIGGIPDAMRGMVPVDLKVTSGSGAVLSWTRGSLPARVARGSTDAGEWLIRRQPEWATAAAMYALVAGVTGAVQAEWHQIDESGPHLRIVEVTLPEAFTADVMRRCHAAWDAFTRCELPEQFAGVRPEDVCVLV